MAEHVKYTGTDGSKTKTAMTWSAVVMLLCLMLGAVQAKKQKIPLYELKEYFASFKS